MLEPCDLLVRFLLGLRDLVRASRLCAHELVQFEMYGARVLGLTMLQQQDEKERDDRAGHVHPGDPGVREADHERNDGPYDDDDERQDERERLAREG